MEKRTISTVITDLDNTLFDWVEMWYQSFSKMLEEIVEKSGIDQSILESEIKKIHETYRTSEYAFLIEKIPSLKNSHGTNTLRKKYASAIEIYRKTREEYLRLYPGVFPTLKALKEAECLIVGYTESMEFYSTDRIQRLKLDGLIDYLYCPANHEVPKGKERKIELKHTKVIHTPEGELKPNPHLLQHIIVATDSRPSQTIYIGDNLFKDILMAQKIKIVDVHAKYGKASNRPEYDLLRRVTHWKEEDVEREKQYTEDQIAASYVLEGSFAEILGLFKFVSFKGSAVSDDGDRLSRTIDIWKKTIDVQMHFNDLELRIRNYGLTVLAAILGVAAFALKENMAVMLGDQRIPLASILLVGAVLIWLSFYFMDRHWYHRLLYGSVMQGQNIENSLKHIYPEIALTESIGKESTLPVKEMFNLKKLWDRLMTFELHSKGKMDLFYFLITVVLIASAIGLFYLQPKDGSDQSNDGKVQETAIEAAGTGVTQTTKDTAPTSDSTASQGKQQ